MVKTDDASIVIDIIRIRKGLCFCRINVIQVLKAALGPIFQIGPAVIIAQGPQLAGLAVKSHALRFFNAHFRRHDEGQADDVVVSPMNVIMDLTSAKGRCFTYKRGHFARKGRIDLIRCRLGSACHYRAFHGHGLLRPRYGPNRRTNSADSCPCGDTCSQEGAAHEDGHCLF